MGYFHFTSRSHSLVRQKFPILENWRYQLWKKKNTCSKIRHLICSLHIILFSFLFVTLGESQRERPFADSLPKCPEQFWGWPGPKPRTERLTQASHMGGRSLSCHPLLPRVCLCWQKAGVRNEAGTPSLTLQLWNAGIPSGCLNSRPTCYFMGCTYLLTWVKVGHPAVCGVWWLCWCEGGQWRMQGSQNRAEAL